MSEYTVIDPVWGFLSIVMPVYNEGTPALSYWKQDPGSRFRQLSGWRCQIDDNSRVAMPGAKSGSAAGWI